MEKIKISLKGSLRRIFTCYEVEREKYHLTQSLRFDDDSKRTFNLFKKPLLEMDYPQAGGVIGERNMFLSVSYQSYFFAYVYHNLYFWIAKKYHQQTAVVTVDQPAHFAMLLIMHLCEKGSKQSLESGGLSDFTSHIRVVNFIDALLEDESLLADQEIIEVLRSIINPPVEDDSSSALLKILWVDELGPRLEKLRQYIVVKNIDDSLAPFSLDSLIRNLCDVCNLDKKNLSDREYRVLLGIIERSLQACIAYKDWSVKHVLPSLQARKTRHEISELINSLSEEINHKFRSLSTFKYNNHTKLELENVKQEDIENASLQKILKAHTELFPIQDPELDEEVQDDFVMVNRNDDALLADNTHLNLLFAESQEKNELLKKHSSFLVQIMTSSCLTLQARDVLTPFVKMLDSESLTTIKAHVEKIEKLVKVLQEVEAILKLGDQTKDAYTKHALNYDKSLFFSHNKNGRRHAEIVIKQWHDNVITMTNNYIMEAREKVSDQTNAGEVDFLDLLNTDSMTFNTKIKNSVKGLIANEKYSSYKKHSFRKYLYCFCEKVIGNESNFVDDIFSKVDSNTMTKQQFKDAENSIASKKN